MLVLPVAASPTRITVYIQLLTLLKVLHILLFALHLISNYLGLIPIITPIPATDLPTEMNGIGSLTRQ